METPSKIEITYIWEVKDHPLAKWRQNEEWLKAVLAMGIIDEPKKGVYRVVYPIKATWNQDGTLSATEITATGDSLLLLANKSYAVFENDTVAIDPDVIEYGELEFNFKKKEFKLKEDKLTKKKKYDANVPYNGVKKGWLLSKADRNKKVKKKLGIKPKPVIGPGVIKIKKEKKKP